MRVLIIQHSDLIPPTNLERPSWDKVNAPWETEYDVATNLPKIGYDVEVLGIQDDIRPLRSALYEHKPHAVFNLLEEFKGEAIFDQNVVSYLELFGVPYTGSNPKGLILARDKSLSKKIMNYHKIKTAKFQVFPRNQPNRKVTLKTFPAIVKCLNEEASLGLSQASVVKTPEQLKERVQFVHRNFNTDAIAEQFIRGQEYFVGVLGNYRLTALPVWALNFEDAKDPESQFYSTNAKFNEKYRERYGIETGKADISERLEERLQKVAKKTYKALNLSGYARIELRVDADENIYVIEANPNPDISEEDDFAISALAAGIKYPELLDKLVKLGRQWSPTDPGGAV